jgi:hypothetical protein
VMYQTMNFNPPPPTTLNPELPEVVNFIIAKALAKNVDERYQKAAELSNDLRRVTAVFTGDSGPPHDFVSSPLPTAFIEPLSPLTRQEDKQARILGMADEAGLHRDAEYSSQPETPQPAESSLPALGLSKAFDSFDATMRLAALTGMEKQLDTFSETQKIARLKSLADAKRGAASAAASALSGSATWKQLATERQDPAPMTANQFKMIWLGSGALVVAALLLFLLR